METVNILEKKLLELNKSLPKLPRDITKFLANYAWLLVLIGVVIVGFSMLPLLGFGAFGSALLMSVGAAGLAALAWSTILFSVIGTIIVIVVELMAISPLKKKQHRGWQLLFIAFLLQATFSVLGSVFGGNISDLLGVAIGIAIGGYILAQVHEYFPKQGAKALETIKSAEAVKSEPKVEAKKEDKIASTNDDK